MKKICHHLIKLGRFIVAWFRIPRGMYCYTSKKFGNIPCPYWRRVDDRPEQANGWCNYLGMGDVEIAKGRTFKVVYVNEEDKKAGVKVGDITSGEGQSYASLLWDRCKECGIKDEG